MAEWTGLKQTKIKNRLILTIPMLAVAVILTQIDFDIMWRYFSLANQALAAISLWTATSYLIHKGKYRFGSLITALPAAFMSAVTMTYLLMADEGFRLALKVSYPSGIALAVFLLVIYGLQMLQWRFAGEEYRANWSQIERFRKLHG